MKAKFLFGILLVGLLAGGGGWFAGRQWHPATKTAPSNSPGGRKILYYQSAMHPWIKSDKPGKCTICGMDLVPVFEGEKGFDVGPGMVTLNSNSISVAHVQTVEARRQPLQRTLRVAGVIEDDDTRHRILSAYVDGRIDRLGVNYVGAEVKQGQSLATLYSPALLNAQREYISAVRQGGTGESAELKEINNHLRASAAQRLRQLGLSDKQIQDLPQKKDLGITTDVLAPMSGTVVARFVYEGQYVKEGDKLFEISDFSTMWFQFDAYEKDLAWIVPGQVVEVTTPAVPGKVFQGKISFIDPNIKEMTRTAKVRVEIPNPLVEENGRPHRALFHKLFAEAAVNAELPQTLAVPRSAVLAGGQQPLVYVEKEGGTYEQRPVKLGRAGDDLWEVLDGLSEGERVVTTGNLLIDAQAQLNESSRSQSGLPAPPASSSQPGNSSLTPAQREAARQFLVMADALSKSLSQDNLGGFNEQAAKVHSALPQLLK